MYANPRHIRDHEVKVRLNEEEIHLLEALAQYNHSQKAVFARDLLLASLDRINVEETQASLLG